MPNKREGHPIALCVCVVKGLRKTEPTHWAAKTFIRPDRIIVGDGLACFRGIAVSRYRGIADAGINQQAMETGSVAAGLE